MEAKGSCRSKKQLQQLSADSLEGLGGARFTTISLAKQARAQSFGVWGTELAAWDSCSV